MNVNTAKAMYAILDKASKIEGLRGMFYNDGVVVSSNNTVIIVLRTEYSSNLEGKVISLEGKEIKAPYPNYKGAMYFNPSETSSCPESRQTIVSSCLNLPKTPDVDHQRVCLEFGGVCVFPPRLLKVLEVFEAIREEPDVYAYTPDTLVNWRLILKSESCTAIMAPVYLPENDGNRFTVKEAIELGELL